MQTSTLARAKLVKNARLNTFKLVVAFNVFEMQTNGKYKFPVQKKCDFVSGDIQVEDVPSIIARAERVLRTNNIELV